MFRQAAFVCAVILSTTTANAADLTARVVDVGAGLCVVVDLPDAGLLVYDTGHWTGRRCIKAITALMSPEQPIELLVLSHTDSDHLGDANDILREFDVKRVLRTGFRRTGRSDELRPGSPLRIVEMVWSAAPRPGMARD